MKQLLIETIEVKPNQVGKGSTGGYVAESIGGKLIVTLPATVCDKKNLNERVYSSALMEGVAKRSKNAFESRELLSSVNEHPSDPYVTPGQASHVVIDAWVQEGVFYNKWEILETATGKDLRALIESGVSFGVSIRGLGSVDYNGNIQEDYDYLGTDCVAEPSAQLRVRPEIVKESATVPGKNSSNNGFTKESKDMKDKASVTRYLSEQKVLMQSEMQGENKVAAFQRAASVEEVLAESSLQGKDLAEVFTLWEGIKKDCLDVKEAAASEDKSALYGKVIEQRNKQLNTMAKNITQVTQQLQETKVAAATKVNASDRRAKTAEAQLKHAVKESAKLKAENAKLRARNDSLLAEMVKKNFAYRLAVKEAAKLNFAYKVAVQEAARVAKGKKLIVVKEAKKALTESMFTFFTDADYQSFAGAGRPFGKMEPMIAEGNNYQAVLAGTDDGATQVQIFTEDGSMWAKPVNEWSEFVGQVANELPETVDAAKLQAMGFENLSGGFGESKAKSFKTAAKKPTVQESSKGRVIDNGRGSKEEKPAVQESAFERGEHKIPGWL